MTCSSPIRPHVRAKLLRPHQSRLLFPAAGSRRHGKLALLVLKIHQRVN